MDLARVGATSSPARHTWEPGECALYAAVIGAGVDETEFTLDTYRGKDQLVYPTFVLSGVLAAESRTWPDPAFRTGDYDIDDLVLGEQAVVMHRAVPACGDVDVVTSVGAIYDKGSGALVVLESVAVVLIGLGGALLPFPFWLAGALVAMFSRLWDGKDKLLALTGPVLVDLAGSVLSAVLMGGHANPVMIYTHALHVDSGLWIRLGCVLTALYLGWRVSQGRRVKIPPWQR